MVLWSNVGPMDPSIAPLNPNLPYASILSLIHTHRDHQKHRLAQHHRMLLSTKSRGANAPTFAMPTSRRLIPCRLTAAAAAQVRAVSHTTTTARHLQVAAAAAASQAAVDVSAAGGAPQNQQQQTKQTQPQTRKKEFNWFKQVCVVVCMCATTGRDVCELLILSCWPTTGTPGAAFHLLLFNYCFCCPFASPPSLVPSLAVVPRGADGQP